MSEPRRNNFCAVKIGDGDYTYSKGEKEVDVVLKSFGLKQTCIVMDTTAFDVCIVVNFVRENPEVIVGFLFTPSQLIVRTTETQQVDLVSLTDSEGRASPDHEVHGMPCGRQRSLCYGKREHYCLLPDFKAQVLAEIGDLVCTVDLYASPRNNTEALYCGPLISCYGYDWSRLVLCWASPRWSHILKMLTKAVLGRAKVVVITPDWGHTGEAAKWGPLLHRLTKMRVPLPDVPLYVPDGAKTPLPAPHWGSIGS